MRLIIPSMTLLLLGGAIAVGAQAPKKAPDAAPDPAIAQDAYGRFLPLQGAPNFRDMGGYRTADGRHVRRGVLYRSGAMSGLTKADTAYLERLGIKSVTDLRSESERRSGPTAWKGTYDYWPAELDLASVFSTTGERTPEVMRAAMTNMYRKLPIALKPAYAHIFQELVAGRVPLAFNCTAGKDRAGIAAALILSALGVPRQTVVEDYLLSNEQANRRAVLAGKPRVAMTALTMSPTSGVDKAYIDAMFETIDQRYGSVEKYLRQELGVGPAELRKMRARLLV